MDKEKLSKMLRCQEGDPSAQEELVLETQDAVYYQCRKMLKNKHDAEDVTQEILIAMLGGLNSLKEPDAFWGWLHRIIANRCKNALTRGSRDLFIAENEEGYSLLDSLEELDEQIVPDKALDSSETQRMITELVDALPPEQRSCVLMYYYSELSVKEIADATETAEGTVKSRLNYARKSIKEGVENYEKQGVKLYGASPLSFLLYFLRKDAAVVGLSEAAKQSITSAVLSGAQVAAAAAENIAAENIADAAVSGIKKAVKATSKASVFGSIGAGVGISATVVKVVAVVVASAIAVGAFVLLPADDEPTDTGAASESAVSSQITVTPTPEPSIPSSSSIEEEESQEPIYAQVVEGFQSYIDLSSYADLVDFDTEYNSAADVLNYFYEDYYYSLQIVDGNERKNFHNVQQWFERAIELSTGDILLWSSSEEERTIDSSEALSMAKWIDNPIDNPNREVSFHVGVIFDWANSFGEYYEVRIPTEFGYIVIGDSDGEPYFFVSFNRDIRDVPWDESIDFNRTRLEVLNHLMGRNLTDVEAALFLLGGTSEDIYYNFYMVWDRQSAEIPLPAIYTTTGGGYCLY